MKFLKYCFFEIQVKDVSIMQCRFFVAITLVRTLSLQVILYYHKAKWHYPKIPKFTGRLQLGYCMFFCGDDITYVEILSNHLKLCNITLWKRNKNSTGIRIKVLLPKTEKPTQSRGEKLCTFMRLTSHLMPQYFVDWSFFIKITKICKKSRCENLAHL